MPAVIANYPNRAASDVDGYIATMDCRDMGRRFVLELAGQSYLVAVADCANVKDVAHIKDAFGGRWLADVDEQLWGDLPRVPTEATLWPERVYRAWQWQMERIQ